MTEADWSALTAWPEAGGYNAAPAYLRPYFRQLNRFAYLDGEGRLTDAGRASRADNA